MLNLQYEVDSVLVPFSDPPMDCTKDKPACHAILNPGYGMWAHVI
jgi:hypothetical protein